MIPAANLLLELYLKGYVWKELQSSAQTYLQSKTPQYNDDREKQFSSPQLVWMTTQALYARVRYLWDIGLTQYSERNADLGIGPPENQPIHPPPVKPMHRRHSIHKLEDPFHWSMWIPASIQ